MSLADKIALATRHVERGRQIIARQHKIIAEGNLGQAALDQLEIFKRTQELFESDLANLLAKK